MKKITLLTATALTLTCLGGQTLTAQAAPKNLQQISLNGNRVVVTYGYGCDIKDLLNNLDNLQNRFPCISVPECELPEINIPGVNMPGDECPDVNIPGTNIPDVDAPDADAPDTNLPGTNNPDADTPNTNTPDINLPGTDTPDADTPNTNAPDINLPGTDAPDADTPGTNTPDIDLPDTNMPGSNDKPENNNGNNNGNNNDNNNTEENAPETETPDGTTGHAYIRQVVNLVNAERAKEGLSPLTVNSKVQAAAQVRAKECEQSFSHTRPNGSSFATALKDQNVSYRSAGENIAWGQRSPEEVVNAWMNSSGHRANIMNPNYTTIGVGYYQNANGTNYWCQLFTN